MASAYAKQMMKDAARKKEDKKIAKQLKLPNAYTAALTDYMRRAAIETMYLRENSEEGEIKVMVRKKGFDIQKVELIVADLNGTTLELDEAHKGPAGVWSY